MLWVILAVTATVPMPSRAGSSVIAPVFVLHSPEFPAVVVLPNGDRVARSALRRIAAGFAANDVLVYDLESARTVRRADSTLGAELLRTNASLASISIYGLFTHAYHQPRLNELLGGALGSTGQFAVTTDRPFLSQPLPLSELDSDLDGLSDLVETETGTFVSASDTGSSPIDDDSDADGLPDGYEVLVAGTDPNRADTDSDGLSDYDELATHQTDPLLDDSDADGLLDGDEVLLYGTFPLLADSDSGGRTDGEEILEDGTDPLDFSDDLVPPAVPALSARALLLLLSILGGLGLTGAGTGRLRGANRRY
jgi:hypothetical protein